MAKKLTPMALLCGYLGAGKTTLMNKILSNQQGYKVAVIVNDIGEVNVDAKLIADGAKITDTSDIVPLTNGCICCTLKSALAQNIENLIKTGKYDYILIEASGVCEPMPIAQELETIKNGKLDNVIGVVDAARLVDEFAGGDKLLHKDDMGEEDIESCSTLVINKKDLVSESDFAKVRKVIEALHPGVKIIETSHGDVPIADMLATNSFDFEEVYASAGWCKKLEEGEDEDDDDDDDHDEHHHEHHEEHDHHDGDEHEHHEHHHHEHKHEGDSGADEDEYGIGTFIYMRRRPFDRQKLDSFASRWPRNIIRCKGLCWFSDEDDMAVVFETSGRQIQAGYSGQWIATASAAEREEILAKNPQIKAEWDEKVGDRMIKLCIIGQNLDKAKIAADLDACLA